MGRKWCWDEIPPERTPKTTFSVNPSGDRQEMGFLRQILNWNVHMDTSKAFPFRKLGSSPFRKYILYFLHINYPHWTETRGAASPGEKRQNLYKTEINWNYFKCYFSNRIDIGVFIYIHENMHLYKVPSCSKRSFWSVSLLKHFFFPGNSFSF